MHQPPKPTPPQNPPQSVRSETGAAVGATQGRKSTVLTASLHGHDMEAETVRRPELRSTSKRPTARSRRLPLFRNDRAHRRLLLCTRIVPYPYDTRYLVPHRTGRLRLYNYTIYVTYLPACAGRIAAMVPPPPGGCMIAVYIGISCNTHTWSRPVRVT